MIRADVRAELDAAAVAGAAGAQARAALTRFGAFVRRRMMSSIRYRKRRSRAGEPPTAHRSDRFTREKTDKKTGATTRQASSPLRELIAFAVVDGGMAVIIGPMIFRASKAGGGVAPRALEEGGAGVFYVRGERKAGRWAPRPFARPAFAAELPRAPKLFAAGRK